MKKNNIYDERLQRILIAAENKEPDRVPVAALIETYTLAYAGTTIEATQKNLVKHVQAYGKIYEDIYYDSAFVPYLTHAIKLGQGLGSDVFFASDDGVTLQHKEYCPMVPEDYENFTKDPVAWIIDEFLPRKFPKFDATNDEQQKAFIGSLIPFVEFAATMMFGNIYFKHALKMPVMVGGSAEMPFDMLFDYLRGFKPTITDIRRRPKEVEAAINAVLDYCVDLVKMTHIMMTMPPSPKDIPWLLKNGINAVIRGGEPELKPFPFIFNPCHIPPFLNEKQFDEFYWPTYQHIAERIQNNGGHMLTVLEGKWGPNLNRLRDLPAHSVTFIVENDDICDVKKILGDKLSIMGGMPLAMLRDSTKQQCIDHAKRIVDECAPGGGFFFSTDKVLLAPGDAQVANLKAVNEFVHVYGQY